MKKSERYTNEKTGISYDLHVHGLDASDWSITVLDTSGKISDTLYPPQGLMELPNSMRQTIKKEIGRLQSNLRADQNIKKA